MLLAGDRAGMYSVRIRRCGKYRSRSERMVGHSEKDPEVSTGKSASRP
jgi:hypothetical protein